jgi:site-specific recombinase XerD
MTDESAYKHPPKRYVSGATFVPDTGEERKTVTVPRQRARHPKPDEAGSFAADIASFRLYLAARNMAQATIRIYTGAACWFAVSHLLSQTDKTRWEQVEAVDIRRWIVWLLGRYADAYAHQQYRALEQFFAWLSDEEEFSNPMARMRAPRVTEKPVPYFTSEELSRMEKECRGNSFQDRRDAAIIAVLKATGVRLAEVTGIRYHPDDPARSDLNLGAREIRVRGKGGKERVVPVTREAAYRLDRYLRARSRHALAYRQGLWLGVGSRGPLTASGIYQIVARLGEKCGVPVYPHRFRHHFSHTWLDRGGAEGELMELNGWSSPQMLERYGRSARGARARRHYDLVMND